MKPLRISLAFFFLLLAWRLGNASSQDGEEKLPYTLYPDHCRAVLELLKGEGDPHEVTGAIDEALHGAILRGDLKKISELLTLRGAAGVFSRTSDARTARLLFQDPNWFSRFLHNLDEGDDLDGALKVLRTLYDFDSKQFARRFEFCLAYAMVWDRFRGHGWVRSPMEKDTMIETYKFFLKNENKMLIKPGALPCELNVFVAGTRLSSEEREWVLKNYRAKSLNPYTVYSSVPWTLNNPITLSPGHGKGLETPYTLENIKKIGGCCMEQAYFTENVFRLFGVPAAYTSGRGSRSGAGHAWAGVLQTKSKKAREWDFGIGRYQSHHYYKGELRDPTNPNKTLTDSEVKLLSAFLKDAGSLSKMEESNFYLDAALWAEVNLREKMEDSGRTVEKMDLQRDLLVKSLEAAKFNVKTWQFLSQLAAERRMSEKPAAFWIEKAAKYTLEDYPDFTVDLLGGFLGCIEDPKEKIQILETIFKELEKTRPDLACDIKVMEGDFWLELKNLRKGLQCFIYPLAHFSEDKHILDTAWARLRTIESQIQEPEEVIRAYEMIFLSTRKKSRTMSDLRELAAKKLVALYTEQGDESKAKKYAKYATAGKKGEKRP